MASSSSSVYLPASQASSLGDVKLSVLSKGLGYVMLCLFIATACIALIEPSPYDFIAIPTILLWFAIGLKLHRAVIPFIALLLIYNFALAMALLPYMGEPNPFIWTIQSFYLMVTALFFVMFFSEHTEWRMELALKAYVASCLVSGSLGIVGYFDIAGLGETFSRFDRATGTFTDPNVLGSFLILGAVYIIHNMATGNTRRYVLSSLALIIMLAGIFLSFSRGSWAAALVAFSLSIGLAFYTTPYAAVRRRILVMGLITMGVGFAAIAALLSVSDVATKFEKRAQVTQDYDEGETGRFGNQLRSIPMLIERPMGFGPLRFRLTFGLEPHNSYIGGFANGGWLGGLAFLGLVLTTTYVGFRLCLRPSPYQRLAQIIWPALFIFFLQAVQIDVEKWRHVYMMLGMIWGLEAARVRWVRQQRRLA